MVAITVILAAVIASVMMGFTDGIGDQTPTISGEVTVNSGYDNSEHTGGGSEFAYISHTTGDTIAEDDIRVVVRNSDGASIASLTSASPRQTLSNSNDEGDIVASIPGDFNAGATITLSAEAADDTSDFTGDMDHGNTIEIQVIDRASDTTVISSEVTLPN